MTLHWVRWQTGVDTGIYTQVVLNVFHGYRSTFENGSHFAVHFSPLLGIFYPLVALARSGLALEYAQVVLIAAVPVALYALVRPHLDDALAVRIGFIALLYPPLAAIGIGEFHVLACLPLLVIGALWAADRGRWGWFACFGSLTLLVREDVLLELAVIGAVGGFAALRSKHGVGSLLDAQQRRQALGIALFGVAGAAIALAAAYFGIIQPANGRYGWYPLLYYRYGVAHGTSGILSAPPVGPPPNPATTLLKAAIGRLTYLLEVFVPLALLSLRTRWWLLALPGLAIVLAATGQSIWTMGSQYSLLWAPWLLLATAFALIQIEATRGAVTARRWADAALVGCVVFLVAFNPMHLSYYLRPPYHDLAAARRALACVPSDASLATHDEWFTHIAASRPRASGNVLDGVEYLVYAGDYGDASFQREVRPKLDAALAARRFQLICAAGDVRAYRRVARSGD